MFLPIRLDQFERVVQSAIDDAGQRQARDDFTVFGFEFQFEGFVEVFPRFGQFVLTQPNLASTRERFRKLCVELNRQVVELNRLLLGLFLSLLVILIDTGQQPLLGLQDVLKAGRALLDVLQRGGSVALLVGVRGFFGFEQRVACAGCAQVAECIRDVGDQRQ